MVKDCASIEVTLFDVQKDTMYEYKLYDSDHKSLFSVTSNKTTELIPTNFLYDHTGEYIIVVVPAMNPAGSGQPVNYTLDLSAINELQFNVTGAEIETNTNGEFYLNLWIKINNTCYLTVPNSFFISSNCSRMGRTYLVDMENFRDSTININYPLLPSKTYCDVFVKDNSGTNYTSNTNQSGAEVFVYAGVQVYVNHECHVSSVHNIIMNEPHYSYNDTANSNAYIRKHGHGTYNVRSFSAVPVNNSFIKTMCKFIATTRADGCLIFVYDEYGNLSNETIIYVENSAHYVWIGPLPPGNYTIFVYDLINGTHNASDDVFNITVVLFPYQSTILPPLPTTEVPSPPPTDGVGKDEAIPFVPIIVMGVVIFVIVAVGIITILLIIFCCNKDQRYNLEHRDREREPAEGVIVNRVDPYDIGPPKNAQMNNNGYANQEHVHGRIKDNKDQNHDQILAGHKKSTNSSEMNTNKGSDHCQSTDQQPTESMEMRAQQLPEQSFCQKTETSLMEPEHLAMLNDKAQMDQVTNAPPAPSSSPLQPPVEDTFTESVTSISAQEHTKIRRPSQVSGVENESEICIPRNDSTISFKEIDHEMVITSNSSQTATENPPNQLMEGQYYQDPSTEFEPNKGEVVQHTYSSPAQASTQPTDSSVHSEHAPLIP